MLNSITNFILYIEIEMCLQIINWHGTENLYTPFFLNKKKGQL